MKKTFITLFALSSMALADSDLLTLSPYYMQNGEKHNLVTDYIARDSGSGIMNYFTGDGTPGYTLDTMSFTMTVQELLGAENLTSTDTLMLQSLTYYGQTQKFFVGGGRSVTVSVNGTEKSVSVPLSSQTEHAITLDYSGVESPLTFTKDDVLTFTWSSTNSAEGVSASVLVDNKGANPQMTGISPQSGLTKYGDTPTYLVAQIGVKVVPEPATATLSLLALAGLAARRRRH